MDGPDPGHALSAQWSQDLVSTHMDYGFSREESMSILLAVLGRPATTPASPELEEFMAKYSLLADRALEDE